MKTLTPPEPVNTGRSKQAASRSAKSPQNGGLAGGIRRWATTLFGHSKEPAVCVEKPAAVVPVEITPARDGEISLPLAVLFSSLPPALQTLAVSGQLPHAMVSLPVDRIVSQLGRGNVHVTFGEIRRSVPDAFIADASQDQVEIALPLKELVMRLGPSALQRRSRKKIDLPTNISSPFGVEKSWSADLSNVSEVAPHPAPEPAVNLVDQAPAVDLPVCSLYGIESTPASTSISMAGDTATLPNQIPAAEVAANTISFRLEEDAKPDGYETSVGLDSSVDQVSEPESPPTTSSAQSSLEEGVPDSPDSLLEPMAQPVIGLRLASDTAESVVENSDASPPQRSVEPENINAIPLAAHADFETEPEQQAAAPVSRPADVSIETIEPVTESTPRSISAGTETFIVEVPVEPVPSVVDGKLYLHLAALASVFPAELKQLIVSGNQTSDMVPLSVDRISSQLSLGAVRFTFGEIRCGAPHLFADNAESDDVTISLPLNALVSRLGPEVLQRRNQKKLQISAEIPGLFSADIAPPVDFGKDSKESVEETAQAQPASVPEMASASDQERHEAPTEGEAVAAVSQTDKSVTGETNVALSLVIASNNIGAETAATSASPLGESTVCEDSIETPSPAAPVAPKPPERPAVPIRLAALVARWPEPLRNVIAESGISDVNVALPVDEIEPGLKSGKLSFKWEQIRQWITPPAPDFPAGHDALELNLPLSAVAIAFLSYQREKAQPATQEAPPRTIEPAVETSPRSVVRAAAGLPGVRGALVALPDGLCVASELDSSLDGDALAALLPQAYGVMRSWTKDLRFGELSELSFTAGNKTWKILRVNGLFFIAFGNAGANLPGAELARLAGTLNAWEGN